MSDEIILLPQGKQNFNTLTMISYYNIIQYKNIEHMVYKIRMRRIILSVQKM